VYTRGLRLTMDQTARKNQLLAERTLGIGAIFMHKFTNTDIYHNGIIFLFLRSHFCHFRSNFSVSDLFHGFFDIPSVSVCSVSQNKLSRHCKYLTAAGSFFLWVTLYRKQNIISPKMEG
jgi:hypothetical protein